MLGGGAIGGGELAGGAGLEAAPPDAPIWNLPPSAWNSFQPVHSRTTAATNPTAKSQVCHMANSCNSST
jgi:hypothetical protein